MTCLLVFAGNDPATLPAPLALPLGDPVAKQR